MAQLNINETSVRHAYCPGIDTAKNALHVMGVKPFIHTNVFEAS